MTVDTEVDFIVPSASGPTKGAVILEPTYSRDARSLAECQGWIGNCVFFLRVLVFFSLPFFGDVQNTSCRTRIMNDMILDAIFEAQ